MRAFDPVFAPPGLSGAAPVFAGMATHFDRSPGQTMVKRLAFPSPEPA